MGEVIGDIVQASTLVVPEGAAKNDTTLSGQLFLSGNLLCFNVGNATKYISGMVTPTG